jgi:hypothetical protein
MTWLFVLGAHIFVPIVTSGANIGTTKYCFLQHRTNLANLLTSASVFIHDSLVFIATSWAFMRISFSNVNVKNGIGVMVFGRNLTPFSKSILRDGQAYFL